MRSTLSVADCLQLISTVDAVEVLEAFKRIPEEFRGYTFFGADDRWLYIKSGTPNFVRTVWAMTVKSPMVIVFASSFLICELLMRTRLTPMSIHN